MDGARQEHQEDPPMTPDSSLCPRKLSVRSDQLAGEVTLTQTNRTPDLRLLVGTLQNVVRFCSPSSPAVTGQNYLMLLLKLSLVILVANLVLKITDSLSCALITLLTFPSQVNDSRSAVAIATAPTIGD